MAGLLLEAGELGRADELLVRAYELAGHLPPERQRRFRVTSTATALYRARLDGDLEEALSAARLALSEDWDRSVAVEVRALALANLGLAEFWTGDVDQALERLQARGRAGARVRQRLRPVRRRELPGRRARAAGQAGRRAQQGAHRDPAGRAARVGGGRSHRHRVRDARDGPPVVERARRGRARRRPRARGGRAEPRAAAGPAGGPDPGEDLRRSRRSDDGARRPARRRSWLDSCRTGCGSRRACWRARCGWRWASRCERAACSKRAARRTCPTRRSRWRGSSSPSASRRLRCGPSPASWPTTATRSCRSRERRRGPWTRSRATRSTTRQGALRAIERALDLAEPRGYSNPILRYGAPVRSLLRRRIAGGTAHRAFAGELLSALEEKAAVRRPGGDACCSSRSAGASSRSSASSPRSCRIPRSRRRCSSP